jgi:succinate dehydrogenase / fumarate reductase cytochrome b subunit
MNFLTTSTGKKYLMAFSGLILVLFVISHLLGNLQVFLGPEAINHYALFLQNLGELLWVARIGLLVMIGIHIWTAISLTLENRAARPIPYAQKNYKKASYASRTMAVSGLIVLAFIIYHLMQYTFMVTHPYYRGLKDPLGRHDVYSMIVLGFTQPFIALWYVVGIFLLCQHLSHGVSSMFQSLGLNNQSLRTRLTRGGQIFSWAIFAGYISMPIAVQLGILRLPPWAIHP